MTKTHEDFVDFVISEWSKKGKINKKKARECIEAMLWLMSRYRLKCLIGSIIDLDDLIEKYSNA